MASPKVAGQMSNSGERQSETSVVPDAQQSPPAPSPVEPAEPAPRPVPAEDPVAEARVVLENYLAADLGHDGEEMAKYLGGQAAARFRPEVQGQEDVEVASEKVVGHEVQDASDDRLQRRSHMVGGGRPHGDDNGSVHF